MRRIVVTLLVVILSATSCSSNDAPTLAEPQPDGTVPVATTVPIVVGRNATGTDDGAEDAMSGSGGDADAEGDGGTGVGSDPSTDAGTDAESGSPSSAGSSGGSGGSAPADADPDADPDDPDGTGGTGRAAQGGGSTSTAAARRTTTTGLATTTTVARSATTTTEADDGTTGDRPTTRDDPVDPLIGASTSPVESDPSSDETAHVTRVTLSAEADYDRFEIEFEGDVPPPGYDVRYLSPPIFEDPTGDVVTIEGEAFLRVNLVPASGVDLSGDSARRTYTGPRRITGRGVVAEAVNTGDFESFVTWVLGVPARKVFQVTTLSNPVRLVIFISNDEDPD